MQIFLKRCTFPEATTHESDGILWQSSEKAAAQIAQQESCETRSEQRRQSLFATRNDVAWRKLFPC